MMIRRLQEENVERELTMTAVLHSVNAFLKVAPPSPLQSRSDSLNTKSRISVHPDA
jgi:hypothetical protein